MTNRASSARHFRRERQRVLPQALAVLTGLLLLTLCAVSLHTKPAAQAEPPWLALSHIAERNVFKDPHVYCRKSKPTNFLRSNNRGWLALLLPAIIFCFGGLAVITDDYFVPALERLCAQLKVSEDVAGATWMAAGSSAPELFTALIATFRTKDDVGVGTIVGSAVFNILVIIGLSAALSPGAPKLDFRPLLRDTLFYTASVTLLLVFVIGGKVQWWEALILVLFYICYILFMKFANKTYMKRTAKYATPEPSESSQSDNTIPNDVEGAYGTAEQPQLAPPVAPSPFDEQSPEDLDHFEQDSDSPNRIFERPKSIIDWFALPLLLPWRAVFAFTVPDVRRDALAKWWPASFALSIAWVMGITFVMVEATTLAGCYIGVPSAIMGLVFLAAGTSVPDALASVAVARKGRGDMAVSNALGSNVFDILLGLGAPWLLGAAIYKQPVAVSATPVTLVIVPIAILFATITLTIAALAFTGWKLSRGLGYTLFALYAAFLLYTILDVTVF